MQVLYDISVLGLGHLEPKSRTGVFRVIENVAEKLVQQTECNIKFCTLEPNQVVDCLNYLAANKNLSSTPFIIEPLLLKKLRLRKQRFALIDTLTQNKSQTLPQKILRKVQIRTLWANEKVYSRLVPSPVPVSKRALQQADIYHSPFNPLSPYITTSGVKQVFLTCYDLIPLLFPQYAETSIVRLIKEVVDGITPETWVLCISHSTRNDLLNYLGSRVDPAKVIVTELAASSLFYKSSDPDHNKAVRRKYAIPEESPYVLSLCTLEPRKNIDQVIRSFVQLITQENITDLNLVLVGTKGWKFEKIFAELAANPAIRNRIIVTGFVDDADLAALYSEALFFVYPSFYEGFGLPPLEAMQCGTPVITSNTSSLPEVVGDCGITIAPTDGEALCSAMLSLYQSPELRQQLSVKAESRAKGFSWERCAAETVTAYKASLAS